MILRYNHYDRANIYSFFSMDDHGCVRINKYLFTPRSLSIYRFSSSFYIYLSKRNKLMNYIDQKRTFGLHDSDSVHDFNRTPNDLVLSKAGTTVDAAVNNLINKDNFIKYTELQTTNNILTTIEN